MKSACLSPVFLSAKRLSTATVNLHEDNNWSVTFNNLYKYENGKEVEYSFDEFEVPGYTVEQGKPVESETEPGKFIITLTNTLVTPTTDDPPVLKELSKDSDKPEEAGTFTFQLEAKSTTVKGMEVADMPMPEGADGTKITVTTKAGVEKEFGVLTFYIAGTYVYEVTEVNDGQENYTYDGTRRGPIIPPGSNSRRTARRWNTPAP